MADEEGIGFDDNELDDSNLEIMKDPISSRRILAKR